MMAPDPFFSFPIIDPVAFSLGPLSVRWYALAYMAGLILGWYLLRRRITSGRSSLSPAQLDMLMNLSVVGILLGGRLGYVLFYQPQYYAAYPAEILKIWQGGMSFHGGFLGVCIIILLTARLYRLDWRDIGDDVAYVAPVGLFFGRVANFINAELYGRVTDSPFGIIFPGAGPLPRHPSQLYEAALEGVVLFIMLALIQHRYRATRPGLLMAVFFAGYGLARFVIEFVREPDAHLGFIIDGAMIQLSMGQLLSLPMLLIGLGWAAIILRRPTGQGC